MSQELLSIIFHPCLVRIEVTCEERQDWTADMSDPPNLAHNPALVLRVIWSSFIIIFIPSLSQFIFREEKSEWIISSYPFFPSLFSIHITET